MENKSNKWLIIFLIIFVLISIGFGSYIVYDKFIKEEPKVEEKENTKEENYKQDETKEEVSKDNDNSIINNKKDETKEEVSKDNDNSIINNKKDETISKSEYGINTSKINEITPYIIDNILYRYNKSNLVDVLSLGSKSTVLDGNNLNNEKFKFLFAFYFGTLIDNSKYLYVLDDENICGDTTGEICIKTRDFEKIFSKIYGEDYKFNKDNLMEGFSYNSNTDYIKGVIFSGYNSDLEFKFDDFEENYELGSGKVLDYYVLSSVYNEDAMIGNIEYFLKRTSDGKYIINDVYFNIGAQSH